MKITPMKSLLKKTKATNGNEAYLPKKGKSSWAILQILASHDDEIIISKDMTRSEIFEEIKSLVSEIECSESRMYHGLRTLQKKRLCEYVSENKKYRLTEEGIQMYRKISSSKNPKDPHQFNHHLLILMMNKKFFALRFLHQKKVSTKRCPNSYSLANPRD